MPATLPSSRTLHPARPGARAFTADDLWALPRVGAPVPSADGSFVVAPVTTWNAETNEAKTRLWRLDVNGRGEPRALTAPEASASSPALSPDDTRLAFVRKGDNGRGQLHVMPLDGGEARRLTDLPLGLFDPTWLPDGRSIVVAAMLLKGFATPDATRAELERREKDPLKAHVTEERLYRYWDTWLTTGEVVHLFVVDTETGAVRDLAPELEVWFEWMDPSGQYDVSPDGREIVFAGIRFDDARSIIKASLWTVPVAGGPAVCHTADHPADDWKPRWTPDGAAVVYGMQHDPEFYADRVRMMRWDRGSGAHTPLIAEWDLSPVHWEFGADGTLVLEAEQAGRVKLFAWRGAGEPRAITPGGSVGGLRVRGGRAFFTLQSLVAPAEVHACALDGSGLAPLSRFTAGVLDGVALGEVREMEFAGSRGETVQMFVVLPPGWKDGEKRPLVHVVHGGPHGISGDAFHPRWNAQLFASPGYVAALVNFQGSTSWGQDFAQRIQGEWAARPFEDVMKATDVLVAAGLADESRMAAAGGSYGGYMMSWIAGHTDRFRCIVNHAGVADLMGQYASDVTQGRGRATGGEAWKDLEKQDRWSPVRFASGMTTPMLVIHGEKDYRVPVGQGLLIYGLLKAKGVPARLVYFPDENHWVLKPRNSIFWYAEVHAWLKRWLGA